MAALDLNRFTKALALAESDQDGEALAAIRAAARMARGAGLSLGQAVDPMTAIHTVAAQAFGTVRRLIELDEIAAAGTRGEEALRAAFDAGARVGGEDTERRLTLRIRQLEIIVDAYRAAIPWSDLVKRYRQRYRRGRKGIWAREMQQRLSVGGLTAEDAAELVSFVNAAAEPTIDRAGNHRAVVAD